MTALKLLLLFVDSWAWELALRAQKPAVVERTGVQANAVWVMDQMARGQPPMQKRYESRARAEHSREPKYVHHNTTNHTHDAKGGYEPF